MEKVNLGYSAKKIPVPNNNIYLQILIGKTEILVQNLRWKVLFFLKPEAKPIPKQTYGFKSIAPAPVIKELNDFEEGLIDLVNNVKFGRTEPFPEFFMFV